MRCRRSPAVSPVSVCLCLDELTDKVSSAAETQDTQSVLDVKVESRLFLQQEPLNIYSPLLLPQKCTFVERYKDKQDLRATYSSLGSDSEI